MAANQRFFYLYNLTLTKIFPWSLPNSSLTRANNIRTMAMKAVPSRMKMISQSGVFRMSDATEIPFCMMYPEVGGKNGPFSAHWAPLAITRMYCRNTTYMYVYSIAQCQLNTGLVCSWNLHEWPWLFQWQMTLHTCIGLVSKEKFTVLDKFQ